MSSPSPSPSPIPPEALSRIQELYDAGLILQAFNAAQPFGPLSHWTGTDAQTLAGRLASNLGASRLAGVLHWRTWRSDKGHPGLAAYYAHILLHRRGPLAAWEFLERQPIASERCSADDLAHFYTVRALVSAHLRDFTAAEAWFSRASTLAPNHPWTATTRAYLLEAQDRYPEALEAARSAQQLRPWYRPAVQALAHALQILDRDEEALAFLTEAAGQIENVHVVRQLADLQKEMGRYSDAVSSLARVEELAPLMEAGERLWLRSQRVTLACLRDDTATAMLEAKQIDEPYYKELGERLQNGAPHRRVQLEVPFVRQHHLTCAPATLSAISRYWRQPAEHLEVAEAICYDGTPAQSERHWAETQGWAVREFTVTWEAATALLDRGIPFTLTTSEATSGHLQAVIGYDEIRQTLWIRDPFIYSTGEFLVKPLLEHYRATGPRGMAMVPAGRRELLEGLELPDANLYDQLFQVQRALAQHRRADALEVCQKMQAAMPAHRLTLTARRAIAAYDSNSPALLACLTELLQQFPDDGNLNLCKLSCLRDLARRDERLALLEQLCAKPGIDPIFWQQYAQELRADARQQNAAASWVRWALRRRPTDPDLVSAWADLLWDQRQFERACRYYGLAACLGDKREQFAQNFFIASRHLRNTESALQFLKERNERLGAQSSSPAITLIESLQRLGRTTESFTLLEAALQRRPDDGSLRLFAADFSGRFSRFETASKRLGEAQDRCPPVAWHRTAASLADYQSEKATALQHWRAVLALEPLAHEAIRAIALLLAETESREAALGFIADLCERFPFSCPLLALRIEWLKADLGAAIAPLRRLLEVNPADAWGWRELALQLAATEKAESLGAAHEAIRLEPNRSIGYSVRAEILLRGGQVGEAREDFRQALRLEVDNGFAVTQYVATAPTLSDRKQALATVTEELRRQVIFDEALFAFQNAARGVLPPSEVLSLLRDAHAARLDLWQAWSVLVHQLIDIGQHADALKLAREATERFPLLPRLWVDLARAEQALLDAAGEIAALEKALELSPAYATAARQLASIYERQNDLPKARAVLERVIVANPLDAANHGCLAQVLWKLGEKEAALAKVQHALRLQPGYDWAWNVLRTWGAELGRPALAAETARDLTTRRAGEARSWFLLAKCLPPETAGDELFAALDRALTLNPRFEDAYDLRAYTLTQLNRFDEALAQCAPEALHPTPARLRIRAAWIEAQRGNLAKAIACAKAALDEHPDFYGGWQLLSDWHIQNEQADEAVQAAEKMASLAPLEPVPLGYLGDLKLRLGDRPGAKAAFERAFTLDPDYLYAGFQLFHLQLEGREYSAADETLKILRRRSKDHETLACSVELTAAQQQREQALEQFEKICSCAEATEWSIATAARAMDQAGSGRSVDRLIEERLEQPEPPAALAELWVERQTLRGRWRLHSRLNALKAEGEPGRRAILRYLDQMGRAFQTARRNKNVTLPWRLRYHFGRLFKKHRYWLESDVDGWGKVGFVLTCIGRPGPVINWLSDWKTRPNAQSWMLYNLVVMLQRKGHFAESLEIIRHGVTLRHGDDLYEVFRLWAAFEEALGGDTVLAERHLAALPAENISEHRRPLQIMTQLLIQLHRKSPEDTATMTQAIRTSLQSAFGERHPYQADQYTRDGYARFIGAAAREGGGLALRLWGFWYYRGTAWLWIALLIVSLPLTIAVPPFWFVLFWLAVNRSRADR